MLYISRHRGNLICDFDLDSHLETQFAFGALTLLINIGLCGCDEVLSRAVWHDQDREAGDVLLTRFVSSIWAELRRCVYVWVMSTDSPASSRSVESVDCPFDLHAITQ